MPSDIRPITRFITGHDQSGKAIFDNTLSEAAPIEVLPPDGVKFFLGYTTNEFPVNLEKNRDIESYKQFISQPPGLVNSTGTVLRVVDMPPGLSSPMHRTVSLDYGVVMDGEVELILDSGEKRTLRRGDIAVQRGTNHLWRNTSETEWCRMLYVLQPSQPLTIGDKTLGEDRGTMEGVRASE